MLDFVALELGQSEEWRHVLEAYRRPQAERVGADVGAEKWRPRVPALPGIDSARLSRLHGTLIALGLLQFEIAGKTGIQYQLTPLGLETLERGLLANAEAEPNLWSAANEAA